MQIPSNIHDKATYFNSTKDGRGYNLLHLNALYDLESQLDLDAIIQDGRKEHESQALVELVDRSELTEPVILIADRGYEAYNNMAHIEQKGWKYLIRVKDKQGILSGLRAAPKNSEKSSAVRKTHGRVVVLDGRQPACVL